MENKANMENKKYDESRIYYVYKHVRLDNNTCFYIGKGKEGRLNVPNRNTIHDNICKKHGYKAGRFKDKWNEEEAFKLEKDLINCYVSKLGYGIYIKGYYVNKENDKFLTNMTWGGEGTSGMNAFANKTEEEMETIGKKMSESHKGKKLSEEHKQKMSESHIGKHHSGETKIKMSKSLKGKNKGKIPWNKGKQLSEEVKRKMSKKVICVTTGKIFNSFKDARNYYKSSNISDCCKGVRKHAGKLQDGTPLQWKYVKDYNNDFNGILINPITE